jgi:hypothetical protein
MVPSKDPRQALGNLEHPKIESATLHDKEVSKKPVLKSSRQEECSLKKIWKMGQLP